MMKPPLIECVPNFSEGEREDVIDRLVGAIRNSSAWLLDHSSDSGHNRTVITFAGEPAAVAEAMMAAARIAVEAIDMDVHEGVHPRIGAVDVIPFVPLRGMTMRECAAFARDFGRTLSQTLDLPVYLYEAAALRPERVDLAVIRRGQYEALKATIARDPRRAPDFGAARIGKAGAVAVGARAPLIAFNVYLYTDDVQIAKRIAKTIRASDGGMPYVKAIGIDNGDGVAVSINLTDYRKTSLSELMYRLTNETEREGAGIRYVELIGLVPLDALLKEPLGWDFTIGRRQILEYRLREYTTDYAGEVEFK